MTPNRATSPRKAAQATAQPADEAAALEMLAAWADADSTALYDERLHSAAGAFLTRCAKRTATPLDPFRISLA